MFISWRDHDPVSGNGEITRPAVGHKNPIQKLIVLDMWKRYHEWILTTEFTWLVKCNVVFETRERIKIEEIEVTYTCPLRDMDSEKSTAIDDAIKQEVIAAITANNSVPDGHKNKGVFQYVDYYAQIIGV